MNLSLLDENLLGSIFSFVPINRLALLSQSRLDLVCKNFYHFLHFKINFWQRIYGREVDETSSQTNQSYKHTVHYVLEEKEAHDTKISDDEEGDENLIDSSQFLYRPEQYSEEDKRQTDVFRWMLVHLIQSKDRLSVGGNAVKENFQVVSSIMTESIHSNTCFAICNVFNRHTELIASGTRDGLIHIYTRDYGKEFSERYNLIKNDDEYMQESDSDYKFSLRVKSAHNDEITCMKFLNSQYFTKRSMHSDNINSLILLTGSKDRTLKMWKITFSEFETLSGKRSISMKLVATLDSHQDWIRDITLISQHPTKIVTTSRDKTIKIWDLNRLDKEITIDLPSTLAWTVADHLDKGYLIVGLANGNLQFYDVMGGKLIYQMKAHSDLISDILYVSNQINPDSPKQLIPLIITISYDKSISIFNALTLERVIQVSEAHSTPLFSLASNGKDCFTTCSVDQFAKQWKIERNDCKLEQLLIGPEKHKQLVSPSPVSSILEISSMFSTRECKIVTSGSKSSNPSAQVIHWNIYQYGYQISNLRKRRDTTVSQMFSSLQRISTL
ncbi:WD40 domain-containing protein [Naegleria gruberi]|uniref:WD40 domain-containing protein n=1 Tax=Naegleria gruberi TaxID=5762 RepID=D2W224_NAEGR|nr:WD40 domain-containing protein [Naegleria gruberi]EFC36868.1 WD40 domain-containing protein [Naegleria gruberi]|eukprot:XP_002669612.1 WD40 domain-containing protein [Naegleria gruberi strain NEG-M]